MNDANTTIDNKFESKEFQESFNKALAEYHSAIDADTNPPEAAQSFMDNIFDKDDDAALAYYKVLESKDETIKSEALKNIVINGSV